MKEQDKHKQDKAQDQTESPQTRKTGGGKDGVQGEGDYQAARRYNKEQEQFAQSGRVEDEARKAAPRDDKEAEELKRAEEETGKKGKQDKQK